MVLGRPPEPILGGSVPAWETPSVHQVEDDEAPIARIPYIQLTKSGA
jgi:hypothetical protein